MVPDPFSRLIRDQPHSFDTHSWSTLAPAVAAAIAATAGALVFWIATTVFPYLSANHDEGVYLQQAAMLLDGQLVVRAGDLVGAFRPWFFVVDGGAMYPKYQPGTAAVFALGKSVFGSFDAVLPVVAALSVLLVYAIATEAFDRPTGVVAALALVGSPLFLVTSATFLPYAPTTLFNLAFALAYVRAIRREHLGYAALAGIAIGIAFLARPYTALLFALPFVGHAIFLLARAWRTDESVRHALVRYGVVSTLGLAFVALTLAYNARLTGDPLLFPYEAFAPRDGIGFGRREILGYDRIYDLPLALRANALVLLSFATDWMVAGPLGTALAVVGVLASVGARGLVGTSSDGAVVAKSDDRADPDDLPDRTLRLLLVGIVVSVVLGNVAFWGNLNILADLGNPDDGLISLFGPFYHFDLLLPVSAFVGAGVVAIVRRAEVEANRRFTPERARLVLLVGLVLSAPAVAVAERGAVEPKVERNAAFTEKFERAYEPFESREFEHALVFLPTPYGDWLAHPFQYLRNGPDLDGDVVFALQRDPAGDFAVVDAYPNRTLYRYTYRGRWIAAPRPQVEPAIQPLDVREGQTVTVRTTVGVPQGSTGATVRVENGGDAVQYAVTEAFDGNLTVQWTITPNGTRVVGENVRAVGNSEHRAIALGDDEPTVLTITFTQPGGATVTYRQEVAAEDVNDERVRVLWPPETSVCRLVMDCGREGTYLPSGDNLPGVRVNATVSVTD